MTENLIRPDEEGERWNGEPHPALRATFPVRGEGLDSVCMPGELESLHESTDILRATVRQLADLVMAMQRRMDELEAMRKQVTVSHGDVKRLNALTRARAKEICGKYGLDDKSEKVIRAAIRKDTLARAGVRDLHDIPATMLPGTERAITAWTNIRLIMERRGT